LERHGSYLTSRIELKNNLIHWFWLWFRNVKDGTSEEEEGKD